MTTRSDKVSYIVKQADELYDEGYLVLPNNVTYHTYMRELRAELHGMSDRALNEEYEGARTLARLYRQSLNRLSHPSRHTLH